MFGNVLLACLIPFVVIYEVWSAEVPECVVRDLGVSTSQPRGLNVWHVVEGYKGLGKFSKFLTLCYG